MDEETKVAGIRTAAVGVAGLFGMSLNDIVAILTGVFILLQIGLLLPKYWSLLTDLWQRRKGDAE